MESVPVSIASPNSIRTSPVLKQVVIINRGQKEKSKKIVEEEPEQVSEEPAISRTRGTTALRSRKAKQNPGIKYTENDEDLISGESLPAQKKKRIYKSRNRNKQPYQLNRIFRKEAKKNFPSFSVNADLNALSLTSFAKEFGVFDLIHFSLPLKLLHLLTDVPQLMEKGFIFVWV